MCGIYLTNIKFSEQEVSQKLELIKFRGPNFTGIKKVDNLTFGHLRLSVIDLEMRANQPMQFGELTIVFNGEIYNFLDIKENLLALGYTFTTTSDTEVLLKAYKEWGEEVVHKLNGMFAFAIYDSVNKTVFCSRDRLGVKPLYYTWENGEFELCSQIRPMSDGKKVDNEAISIYLDCSYIPSPYTIYKNVFKLPPGNNLLFNLKEKIFKIKEYWNLKEVVKANISYDEAKTKLHDLLKDAVKIRLQSDVPIGTFLSGGIDSALISSIASKVSDNPIKTFSIGFSDPKFDESKIAAAYAKVIGSEHTEAILEPDDVLKMIPKLIEVYDEPFADSSALPSLLLNKMTYEHVVVSLSGDGGDESFLGYNHFDLVASSNKIIQIPYAIRQVFSLFLIKNLFGKWTQPLKRFLKNKNTEDLIYGIFIGYNSLTKERNLSWLSQYSIFKNLSKNIIQKTADLNIKLWLENDSNVKVDRASMAYSVEVRSPFLDYRIIEFARTLPIEYRYKKGKKKAILKDILSEYIPEDLFNHPKRGFAIPIASWIRNELKNEFLTNLSDEHLLAIPNLNTVKFKEMLNDHLDCKHDYSSYIWRVYILSKWLQQNNKNKNIYSQKVESNSYI